MKATKRLMRAIAALVASLILCIGVCLAWFSNNGKVDGNGMQSEVRGTNITAFSVKAYYLDVVRENNAVVPNRYTVAKKTENGKDVVAKSENGIMNEYGSLEASASTATALLLEISYEFESPEGKSYGVYAHCASAVRDVNKIEGQDVFSCYLSDAVSVYGATKGGEGRTVAIGDSVTIGADSKDFITKVADGNGEINEVKQEIVLNASPISDSNGNAANAGTFYCVIDYNELHIYELYAIVSENGGTLTSELDFSGNGDIGFYITEVAKVSA